MGDAVGRLGAPIKPMLDLEERLQSYATPHGAVMFGHYTNPPPDDGLRGVSPDDAAGAAAVRLCRGHLFEPLLATGRESRHRACQERCTEPPALAEPADTAARTKHQLATRAGRGVCRSRKQTVEPVFGIIKR